MRFPALLIAILLRSASAELNGHLAGPLAVGVALGLVSFRLPLDEDLGHPGDEAHLELADALADAAHPGARDALVEIDDEELVGELPRLKDADARVADELADLAQVGLGVRLVEHRPRLFPQLAPA